MKAVLIQERNSVMKSMNVDKEYRLDDVPDFFKPLRSIFEDSAFTKLSIQLQDVLYIIYPREQRDDVSWEEGWQAVHEALAKQEVSHAPTS